MKVMPRLTRPDLDLLLDSNLHRIPVYMQDGFLNYLRYGLPPGHFLLAVLSNDLAAACARADETNRYTLFDYIWVLHNYAPAESWGSVEKVGAWIEKGMALRREHAEAGR